MRQAGGAKNAFSNIELIIEVLMQAVTPPTWAVYFVLASRGRGLAEQC